MMVILMSETCWAHKKWNKIASDIKLVFYYSTLPITSGFHDRPTLMLTLFLCGSIVLSPKQKFNIYKFDSKGQAAPLLNAGHDKDLCRLFECLGFCGGPIVVTGPTAFPS